MTAKGSRETVGEDLKESEKIANGVWKRGDPYMMAESLTILQPSGIWNIEEKGTKRRIVWFLRRIQRGKKNLGLSMFK